MSRWSREQRFDLRVLAVLVVLILIMVVIMMTIGRDMFWTAVS